MLVAVSVCRAQSVEAGRISGVVQDASGGVVRNAAVRIRNLATGLAASGAFAQTAPPPQNPLCNTYFGDLHVHTSCSLDADIMGNRNDPRAAYRFGRGAPFTLPGNVKSQLALPLDFMAVTDHDIWLGELALCTDPKSDVYGNNFCTAIRNSSTDREASQRTMFALLPPSLKNPSERVPEICGGPDAASAKCYERATTTWKELQQIANENYHPGKFTTFIGFEWTANLKRFGMLHRNVLFRGTTVPDVVESAIQLNNTPERLWK